MTSWKPPKPNSVRGATNRSATVSGLPAIATSGSQRSVSAPPRSVSRVVVGRPRDGIRQSTYQQRATPSDGGLHRFRRRRSSADRSDRWRLANPDYFDDYVRHGFPMGRLGAAEEVADVIVFLASPRAHWINGRNIPVDGLEQPHAPLDRRPF